MRKYIWVLGIMAATCSVVAMAKDPKLDQKSTVTAASATQMSDAEMDKVTAGGEPATPGLGFVTSLQARNVGNCKLPCGATQTPSGVSPGLGRFTATTTPH